MLNCLNFKIEPGHLLLPISLFSFTIVGCEAPGNNARVDASSTEQKTAPIQHPPAEIIEEKYPDGKLQRRTEAFRNADGDLVTHGKIETFYESGEKQSVVHYVAGSRQGDRIAWYRNGALRSKGQFVNGREDGEWTVWFPNGQKAEERHYDQGAYNGTFKSWHMNGQQKSQGHWANGKRQGVHVTWDEVGDVVQRTDFVNDVPQP